MTKIRIPHVDFELFEIVGSEHNRWKFSDTELGDHIAVMDCLVRYFKGRPDCGIVLYKLHHELDKLLEFREVRERG